MHPGSDDYWDGNWLTSPVTLTVGAFTAKISAGLRAEELVGFRHGLDVLYESLQGEAVLDSLEDWLHLRAVGDGYGHVKIAGEVTDSPGTGNRLAFELRLDQTFLPAIIDALRTIEEHYPVLRGHS